MGKTLVNEADDTCPDYTQPYTQASTQLSSDLGRDGWGTYGVGKDWTALEAKRGSKG